MSLLNEKRHRKRVPVSCLNCKKRKVKCDKQRPCTGCVKNNVGHLCVYVEPVWADKLAQIAADAPIPTHEIKKSIDLQPELEATIAKQESEIKCLRAQLAQLRSHPLRQCETGSESELNSQQIVKPRIENDTVLGPMIPSHLELWQSLQQNHTVLSILKKVHPKKGKATAPLVTVDEVFAMKHFSGKSESDNRDFPPSPLGLYSWLNIIRLDPQLTALWYKITNLQKSYHQYKKSIVKTYPTEYNLSTSSTGNSFNQQTCPVVACEFNTMLEESNIPFHRELSKSVSPSLQLNPLREEDEDAVDMLTSLQRMWAKVKAPPLLSSPLTYSQLDFLVRLYFNKTETCPYKQAILPNEVESRNLLQSFETQIRDLFVCDGDELSLNVGVYSSNKSDDDMMTSLRLKTIYMSMLSIIAEEARDSLQSQSAMSSQYKHSFSHLFPPSFFNSSGENTMLSALADVITLIKKIGKARICKNDIKKLLTFISLMMATLNCILHHYSKDDLPLELTGSFTIVFEILLECIGAEDQSIRIWCDPAQIEFNGNCIDKEEILKLRVLFCQLWSDLVRLVNQVSMGFVPILKHSKRLDLQIYSVLKIIVQAENEKVHVNFLNSLSPAMAESARNLPNTLTVEYLISRALYVLLNGVYGNATSSLVSISTVSELLSQISNWVEDISLTMLPLERYFELRLMLHYLELFIATIIVHQGEDLGDTGLISKLIPFVFSKCLDINKFLQGSCVQFAKTLNPTNVLSIIAEALGRMSHLIAGLLIRFRTESPKRANVDLASNPTHLLVYGPKLDSEAKITISVETKDNLIADTDQTMYLLEKNAPFECVLKKTKIWKFYSTFIRNSHKMNSESYARLHSEAIKSGKLLSMCPVMPTSKYPVSATRTEVAGCPVAHGGMSGFPELKDSRAGTPSLMKFLNSNQSDRSGTKFCPVTHADSGSLLSSITTRSAFDAYPTSGTPPPSLKPNLQKLQSKCPVGSNSGSSANDSGNDATLLKRPFLVMQESRSTDSNNDFFSSDIGFPSASPRCAPPLYPTNLSASSSTQPLSMPLPATPSNAKQEQLDVIDWDSLPNFNFDFMSDESLMYQVNNGDINSLLSDGLLS